jgi:hypothetical protein
MHAPAPRLAQQPPAASDLALIAASCGHAHVPARPAAEGYRYLDLGGDVPPFYLRRFERDGIGAALTLSAPLELSSGEAAERGAHGLARVMVSIGPAGVPWRALASTAFGDARTATLLDDVRRELARLDLVAADACPICRGR